LYQYGIKRADAILVQTVYQQQELMKNFGLPSTLAGMLVAKPFGASGAKDIDVLWVANIRRVKRPDMLVELARAMPSVNFHMAGALVPGDEELYGRIETAARELPNLTFHGGVPYLDIGRLFDRAKVFVNTSDLEGFPNTYLQAWVRGLPVVTTFDPDGLVRSERLGSSHTTVAEMVEGVAAMLRSEETYAAARAAALRFMDERFGDELVLAPYLAALKGTHLNLQRATLRA
jgi:glycosyltransferase involved in cell wall biosynthesis